MDYLLRLKIQWRWRQIKEIGLIILLVLEGLIYWLVYFVCFGWVITIIRRRRFLEKGGVLQGFMGFGGSSSGRVVKVGNDGTGISRITKESILVAETLSADLLWSAPVWPAGVVCKYGNPVSHAAILLAEGNTPTILGGVSLKYLKDGDAVEIDGVKATITLIKP